MIARIRNLLRDTRGVGAVEFAMVAPLIITLIVGTLNIGNYIYAQNSVAAAVDKVGREAAVYPFPSDEKMRTIFADAILKQEATIPVSLAIQRGTTSNGTKYVNLSTTYSLPVELIFVSLGSMPVSADRRVYIPS